MSDLCSKHACIEHDLCHTATQICGCVECRAALRFGLDQHRCAGCRRLLAGYTRVNGSPMCESCIVARGAAQRGLGRLAKDETSSGFPRFDRPPREAYVRVSRPCGGSDCFVEPGVEFRDGDSFSAMSFELYDLCFRNDISERDNDPLVMAKTVEKAIVSRWPDRAYFVEVHSSQGWIQIFQPFGVPRNRTTCTDPAHVCSRLGMPCGGGTEP